MTRISVCLASYNGGVFIYKQLASILEQLSEYDEIIVSDDSSTDNTIQIINSFNDRRIRLIANQTFYNACSNFENALKHATGHYIFLSDQDDIWEKAKVNTMINELKSYDMVICDATIINDKDQVVQESYFSMRKSGQGIAKNILKNPYLGCCMAFKKEILNEALPFPGIIKYHDYWLGFIAGLFYKVKFLPIPLTLYRSHGNNVTSAAKNISSRSLYIKIKDRICLLACTPLLYLRHFKKQNLI